LLLGDAIGLSIPRVQNPAALVYSCSNNQIPSAGYMLNWSHVIRTTSLWLLHSGFLMALQTLWHFPFGAWENYAVHSNTYM